MGITKAQTGKSLILVVDDDAGLRDLIARTLERKGYSVGMASCGKEAVELACQEAPALMLLDYRLPDMTGQEVIAAITEHGPALPFVMMTGQGDERLAVDIMKLGAADYLIKDTDLVDRIPVVVARELNTADMRRQLANAEAALADAQKLDAIGQLAGGVAHDFNNMLGGIMGAAELLEKRLSADADAEKFLSIILHSAERAADLAGKLLAFSRRQSAGSSVIDLHGVIHETISLLQSTIDKRIHIEVDLHAEASMVVGDAAQLQSVFLNLGINSSHAMPDGGLLSFTSKCIDLSEAYCKACSFALTPGLYIEVEVRDNGCGIPLENQARVFEPFFTTKEPGKGTGLGLAAAYGTVRQHKGSISVYSEVGKGTCFRLLLPVTRAAAAQLPPAQASVRGEGLILLVDDEVIMRATGEAMLHELGYRVLLAENGSLALDVFRESPAEIDLVILDMIMPVMNGRDCFSALKKLRPDIPIVLASGFTRSDDLVDMKARGLSGFIQKPFRGADLSQVVASALAGRKPKVHL